MLLLTAVRLPEKRALFWETKVKPVKMFFAATAAAIYASSAYAAIDAEEAKKLGTVLTPFGAESAGSKDGTIPPYTGGLTKPPAAYKPGMKKRPNPFATEKPLFSIDAKSLDKHADRLTSGTIALMQKYPTYRIDVYPTHRTAAFPKYVIDNTLKNALSCKTVNGGLSVEGCYGGIPFPIPKNGYEAMWNHLLRFGGYTYTAEVKTYYVDSAGRAVNVSQDIAEQEYPYYNPKASSTDVYWKLKTSTTGPARAAGERSLLIDPLDQANAGRKIWQYLPGQRRTRVAPDLQYDTPIPNRGGAQTMDDLAVFNGKMDRYDFKLIGKKEMYIPYNTYEFMYECTAEQILQPKHQNPNCLRWELHRVWVVEATLKPGKRHLYHKRTFYLDEDSWGIAMADSYDATGKMYRVGFGFIAPRYEVPAPTASDTFSHYDLINGIYTLTSWPGEGGFYESPKLPDRDWTPESLAGSGVR